jgi:glucose-fructose oxidoreductase
MRFPGERIGQFVCSFGANAHASYQLVGTEGTLVLDNAYEYAEEMTLHVTSKHGSKTRTFEKRDQIAAEIEYFARCVRDDLEPEPSGFEGLADIRILQAIQTSARFGRAVSVEPIPRPRRPDLAQAIAVPPHAQPPLVDVVASSK